MTLTGEHPIHGWTDRDHLIRAVESLRDAAVQLNNAASLLHEGHSQRARDWRIRVGRTDFMAYLNCSQTVCQTAVDAYRAANEAAIIDCPEHVFHVTSSTSTQDSGECEHCGTEMFARGEPLP